MEIAALTSFLAPFLPYFVQAGQKVAGKAADAIGDEAANYAQKLWDRIRPGVEQKPAAQEAVEDISVPATDSSSPGDAPARLRL